MSSKKLSEKSTPSVGKRNRDGPGSDDGDDVIIIDDPSSLHDGLPAISCKKKANVLTQSAPASYVFATGRLVKSSPVACHHLSTSDQALGGQSHVQRCGTSVSQGKREVLSRSASTVKYKQSNSPSTTYLSPDQALTREQMHHNWKPLTSSSNSKNKNMARPIHPSHPSNQRVNLHSSVKESSTVSSSSTNGTSRQAIHSVSMNRNGSKGVGSHTTRAYPVEAFQKAKQATKSVTQSPSSSSRSVKDLVRSGHSRNWREKSNSDKARKVGYTFSPEANGNARTPVKSSDGPRQREWEHLDKLSSSREKSKAVVSPANERSSFLHAASASKQKLSRQNSGHSKFSTVTYGSSDRLEERGIKRHDAPHLFTDTRKVCYVTQTNSVSTGYKNRETKVTPRSPTHIAKCPVVPPATNATSKSPQNSAPLSSATLKHPLSPPASTTTLNFPRSAHPVGTATSKHPLSPVPSTTSQHPPSVHPIANTPSPHPPNPTVANATLKHPQTHSKMFSSKSNSTSETESLSMVSFNDNDLFEVLDSVETESICSGYNNSDTESVGTASEGYCSKSTSEADQPQLSNLIKSVTCRSPSESHVRDFTKSFVKKKRQVARKSTTLNGAKFYKHPLKAGLLRLKRHCTLRIERFQYNKIYARCEVKQRQHTPVVKASVPTEHTGDQITPPVAKKVATSNSNEKSLITKKRGNESKDPSTSVKRPKLSSDIHASKGTQTPSKSRKSCVGKIPMRKETSSDNPKKSAAVSTKHTTGGEAPFTSFTASTSDISSLSTTTVQSVSAVHSKGRKCHHKEVAKKVSVPKKKESDVTGKGCKHFKIQAASPLSTQPIDVSSQIDNVHLPPQKPYPPTSPTRKPPPLILKKSKNEYLNEYCTSRSRSESKLKQHKHNRANCVAVSTPTKLAHSTAGTSQSSCARGAGVTLSGTPCVEETYDRPTSNLVPTVSTATKPACPSTLDVEPSKSQSNCIRQSGEALSSGASHRSRLAREKKPTSSKPVSTPTHPNKLGAQSGVSQSSSTRRAGVPLLDGPTETSHETLHSASLTPDKKAASSELDPAPTEPAHSKKLGAKSGTSQGGYTKGASMALPDGPSEPSHTANRTQDENPALSEPGTPPPLMVNSPRTVEDCHSSSFQSESGKELWNSVALSQSKPAHPNKESSTSQSSYARGAGEVLLGGSSEAFCSAKKPASCEPDTPGPALLTHQLPPLIFKESRTVGEYLNDITRTRFECEPKVCAKETCNRLNSVAVSTPTDPAHPTTIGFTQGMALPGAPSEVLHSASFTPEKKSASSEPGTPVSKRCLSLKRHQRHRTTSLSEAPTESHLTSPPFGASASGVGALATEKWVSKIVHITSHMETESETPQSQPLRPNSLASKSHAMDTVTQLVAREGQHSIDMSGSSALSETEHGTAGCQERSIIASCVEKLSQRDEVYDLRLMKTIAKLAPGSEGGAEDTLAIHTRPSSSNLDEVEEMEVQRKQEGTIGCGLSETSDSSPLRVKVPLAHLSRTPPAVTTRALGMFTDKAVQADRGMIVDKEALDAYLVVKLHEAMLDMKEQLQMMEAQVATITKQKQSLEKMIEFKARYIKDLTTTGFKPAMVDKGTCTDLSLLTPSSNTGVTTATIATQTKKLATMPRVRKTAKLTEKFTQTESSTPNYTSVSSQTEGVVRTVPARLKVPFQSLCLYKHPDSELQHYIEQNNQAVASLNECMEENSTDPIPNQEWLSGPVTEHCSRSVPVSTKVRFLRTIHASNATSKVNCVKCMHSGKPSSTSRQTEAPREDTYMSVETSCASVMPGPSKTSVEAECTCKGKTTRMGKGEDCIPPPLHDSVSRLIELYFKLKALPKEPVQERHMASLLRDTHHLLSHLPVKLTPPTCTEEHLPTSQSPGTVVPTTPPPQSDGAVLSTPSPTTTPAKKPTTPPSAELLLFSPPSTPGAATWSMGAKLQELVDVLCELKERGKELLPKYFKAELARLQQTTQNTLSFVTEGIRHETFTHNESGCIVNSDLQPHPWRDRELRSDPFFRRLCLDVGIRGIIQEIKRLNQKRRKGRCKLLSLHSSGDDSDLDAHSDSPPPSPTLPAKRAKNFGLKKRRKHESGQKGTKMTAKKLKSHTSKMEQIRKVVPKTREREQVANTSVPSPQPTPSTSTKTPSSNSAPTSSCSLDGGVNISSSVVSISTSSSQPVAIPLVVATTATNISMTTSAILHPPPLSSPSRVAPYSKIVAKGDAFQVRVAELQSMVRSPPMQGVSSQQKAMVSSSTVISSTVTSRPLCSAVPFTATPPSSIPSNIDALGGDVNAQHRIAQYILHSRPRTAPEAPRTSQTSQCVQSSPRSTTATKRSHSVPVAVVRTDSQAYKNLQLLQTAVSSVNQRNILDNLQRLLHTFRPMHFDRTTIQKKIDHAYQLLSSPNIADHQIAQFTIAQIGQELHLAAITSMPCWQTQPSMRGTVNVMARPLLPPIIPLPPISISSYQPHPYPISTCTYMTTAAPSSSTQGSFKLSHSFAPSLSTATGTLASGLSRSAAQVAGSGQPQATVSLSTPIAEVLQASTVSEEVQSAHRSATTSGIVLAPSTTVVTVDATNATTTHLAVSIVSGSSTHTATAPAPGSNMSTAATARASGSIAATSRAPGSIVSTTATSRAPGSTTATARSPGSNASTTATARSPGSNASTTATARSPGSNASTTATAPAPGSNASTTATARAPRSNASTTATARAPNVSTTAIASTPGFNVSTTATARAPGSNVSTTATARAPNVSTTAIASTPGFNVSTTATARAPGSNVSTTATARAPGSNVSTTATARAPGSNASIPPTATTRSPGSNASTTAIARAPRSNASTTATARASGSSASIPPTATARSPGSNVSTTAIARAPGSNVSTTATAHAPGSNASITATARAPGSSASIPPTATARAPGSNVSTTATARAPRSNASTTATARAPGSNVSTTAIASTPGFNVSTTATACAPGSNVSTTATARAPGSSASIPPTATTRAPGSNVSTTATARAPGSNASITATARAPGSSASIPPTATARAPGSNASTTATARAPGSNVSTTAIASTPGFNVSTTATARAPGSNVSATATTRAPRSNASTTATVHAPGSSASIPPTATARAPGSNVSTTAIARAPRSNASTTATARAPGSSASIPPTATAGAPGSNASTTATARAPGSSASIPPTATARAPGSNASTTATARSPGSNVSTTAIARAPRSNASTTATAGAPRSNASTTATARAPGTSASIPPTATAGAPGSNVSTTAIARASGSNVSTTATARAPGSSASIPPTATAGAPGSNASTTATARASGSSASIPPTATARSPGSNVSTTAIARAPGSNASTAATARAPRSNASTTATARAPGTSASIPPTATAGAPGSNVSTTAIARASGSNVSTTATARAPRSNVSTTATARAPGSSASIPPTATAGAPRSNASTTATARAPGSSASIPPTATAGAPGSNVSTTAIARASGSNVSTTATTRSPGSNASTTAIARAPRSNASTTATARSPGFNVSTAATPRAPGSNVSTPCAATAHPPQSSVSATSIAHAPGSSLFTTATVCGPGSNVPTPATATARAPGSHVSAPPAATAHAPDSNVSTTTAGVPGSKVSIPSTAIAHAPGSSASTVAHALGSSVSTPSTADSSTASTVRTLASSVSTPSNTHLSTAVSVRTLTSSHPTLSNTPLSTAVSVRTLASSVSTPSTADSSTASSVHTLASSLPTPSNTHLSTAVSVRTLASTAHSSTASSVCTLASSVSTPSNTHLSTAVTSVSTPSTAHSSTASTLASSISIPSNAHRSTAAPSVRALLSSVSTASNTIAHAFAPTPTSDTPTLSAPHHSTVHTNSNSNASSSYSISHSTNRSSVSTTHSNHTTSNENNICAPSSSRDSSVPVATSASRTVFVHPTKSPLLSVHSQHKLSHLHSLAYVPPLPSHAKHASLQVTSPTLPCHPPSVKVQANKVFNGILIKWTFPVEHLSWQNFVERYDLYAFVSLKGTKIPDVSLWGKVGEIKPLALPMAVTLTNFAVGQSYAFAVLVKYVGGVSSQYSEPCTIDM